LKLIIQIPCYNEAETLPETLRALPRQISGIDQVEVLIIDDGSSDQTIQAARSAGVDHIVCLPHHTGLAGAFAAGLNACLELGADVIVNTDADNQYPPEDIPALVQPIIEGKAEMVIGDRGVASLPSFSPIKRLLQTMGSQVVGKAANLPIPDATSGFRAITREAALRTIVVSEYSYTLETLIQAGAHKTRVTYIPIRTNPKTRSSRLMRGITDYVVHSSVTIMRAYTMYRALRVFSIFSLMFLSLGTIGAVRYMYFMSLGQGAGHIQSVILSAVLLIVGVQTFLIGLVADLISFNRKILEEILYRLRKAE
jgi:glycosyltransferase involved in cell wall biosynthesis